MNRFPLSIDLTGKTVFLIGNGKQIQAKAEKIASFGAVLVRQDTFTKSDAEQTPALVIVGDTEIAEAEKIHDLCCRFRIPVNVVDVPRLCSFYFPALITRGDLTVSVSTGGSSPTTAAYLRQKIEDTLPGNTEMILEWVCQHSDDLKSHGILKQAIAAAFSNNRPLTDTEIDDLIAHKQFT